MRATAFRCSSAFTCGDECGAYWRALDSFVSEVCTMPDVGCVTYGEAIARLKDHYALRPTSSL